MTTLDVLYGFLRKTEWYSCARNEQVVFVESLPYARVYETKIWGEFWATLEFSDRISPKFKTRKECHKWIIDDLEGGLP